MTFRNHLSALAALAALVGFTTTADATTVFAQKGSVCSGTWNTGQADAKPNLNLKKPWSLTCTDGDPACDVDGAKNGACQVRVSACALEPTPACNPEQLTKLKLTGPAKKAKIGVPALSPSNCGLAGIVNLKLKKKGDKPSNKVKLGMNFKTTPTGKGKNFLLVQCVPNPGNPTGLVGCDAACPNNPSALGTPKQMCLKVPLVDPATLSNGSDLDTGFSGASHNFPIPAAASLKYCLSNCDPASDDPECDGSGDTGGGSLNGTTFGAPLPLLSAGLPVCVVNRFQPGPITGTFNLDTGAGGISSPNPVNLFSDTYLRAGVPEVCPRCNVPGLTDANAIGQKGTCSNTSTTPGASCVVDGFVKVVGGTGSPDYTLSTSCVPTGRPVGILNIPLRLTTGATQSPPGPNPCGAGKPVDVNQTTDDSCGGGGCGGGCTNCLGGGLNSQGLCIDPKGGIAQTCCNNDSTKSCFNTRNGGTIQRQGSATKESSVYASTFCIATTNSGSIDGVAGLPGPGALLLPAEITVLNHTAQ